MQAGRGKGRCVADVGGDELQQEGRRGWWCWWSPWQEPVAVKEGFAEWLDPWGGEYIRRGRS